MLRQFGINVSRRKAKAFDIFVLVFAAIGLSQLIVWLDRSPPVTVHLRVMRSEDTVVPPGGRFRYTNYFTRQKYCDTQVQRWFVGSDKVVRPIDPLPAAMPTEGLNRRQSAEALITVPRDMPGGVSKSCFQSRWECNPIQRLWPLYGRETCLTFQVQAPSPISLRPAGKRIRVADAEP